MSDAQHCDNCGKVGWRRRMKACPEGWLFREVTIETDYGSNEVSIITVCSEQCANTFWLKGPGRCTTAEVENAPPHVFGIPEAPSVWMLTEELRSSITVIAVCSSLEVAEEEYAKAAEKWKGTTFRRSEWDYPKRSCWDGGDVSVLVRYWATRTELKT